MNKKMKLSLGTLGLVVLMAAPAFANEDMVRNNKLPWKTDRQTNIEIMANKVGISPEELLAKKESGLSCEEFLKENNLSFEEIKEARLEEQFKMVDERVASGDITEEEGKAIKEKVKSHRVLQDGKGPHQGKREGMKLKRNLKEMGNKDGRGLRFNK